VRARGVPGLHSTPACEPRQRCIAWGVARGTSHDMVPNARTHTRCTRMQLDPTADLVGEEVYNDGMAPDDEELALMSQVTAHKDLKVLLVGFRF
jgi:hypothetical protein